MNTVIGLILAFGLNGDPSWETSIVGTFPTVTECRTTSVAKAKADAQAIKDAGATRITVACIDVGTGPAHNAAPEPSTEI